MKPKSKNILWILLATIVLLVAAPVTWVVVTRMESDPPEVEIDLPQPEIGSEQRLQIRFQDEKSGLKRVWIGVFADGEESILLQKDFPTAGLLRGGDQKEIRLEVSIEAKKLGLKDGAATLRLMAVDHSWREWGKGNRGYWEKEIVIDTEPPAIGVLSKAHNVNPGGSGLVLYKVSEPCRESGVMVGDKFFPGYPGGLQDPDVMMAFFALNHQQGKGTDMFLTAVDKAGNRSREWFPYYIRQNNFRQDTIQISDRFLERKMPELTEDLQNAGASLLDKFLYVNGTLRQSNQQKVQSLTRRGEGKIYWQGDFLRLPKAANRAKFADHRIYRYNGRTVDEQDHLGMDLASVAQSQVPAANSGKVVFAGRIGIYGNTIIIDHGFGLFSMYSHLSSTAVEEGRMVDKGTIIGRTGATGLAGGDHLHFSMIVHHTFVNPIEWWDATWIKNNITSKIEMFGG